MKNVKRMVAAGTLMAAMLFGTTFANAGGIIIAGKEEPAASSSDESGGIIGIIIAGLVAGRTGIIIGGTRTNFGIIIGGN